MGKCKMDYSLPKEVYFENLWFAKQYQTLKDKVDSVIHSTPIADGQPRGNKTSDPTGMKASQIEHYRNKIKIIEMAKEQIEPTCKDDIFNNVVYKKPYSGKFSNRTYEKHKRRFVWWVWYYREEYYTNLSNF